MRPLSIHLDQTSLVNKGFIIWSKEHGNNDLYLVYFRALKRKAVINYAKVRARFSFLVL